MGNIMQLITGAIGSVGFGVLFHMKRKYLPLAAVGGFLSWFLFLVCREWWGGVFFPTLADLEWIFMQRFWREPAGRLLHRFLLPL